MRFAEPYWLLLLLFLRRLLGLHAGVVFRDLLAHLPRSFLRVHPEHDAAGPAIGCGDRGSPTTPATAKPVEERFAARPRRTRSEALTDASTSAVMQR